MISSGLHSTDPATVYLSLYNRLAGFRVADLDDALYERRTLTRILGMRRTLFVVPRDLAAVIDAACTKALIAGERRRTFQLLEAEGIENAADVLESACRATLDALRDADGPIPARNLTPLVQELGTRVTMAPGKKYEAAPAITNRVCLHLSTEGHIVRTRPLGSWLSSQYRWTPTERWFDPSPDVPVDDGSSPARHAVAALVRAGYDHRHRVVDEVDEERRDANPGRDRRRRRDGRAGARRRSGAGVGAAGRSRRHAAGGADRSAAAGSRPDDHGVEGARLVLRPEHA